MLILGEFGQLIGDIAMGGGTKHVGGTTLVGFEAAKVVAPCCLLGPLLILPMLPIELPLGGVSEHPRATTTTHQRGVPGTVICTDPHP